MAITHIMWQSLLALPGTRVRYLDISALTTSIVSVGRGLLASSLRGFRRLRYQGLGPDNRSYFDNGLKLGAGPGAEHKLKKNKTLGLFHLSTGYDWHNGNWSIGPVATLDLIEGGDETFYLGVSGGYGF